MSVSLEPLTKSISWTSLWPTPPHPIPPLPTDGEGRRHMRTSFRKVALTCVTAALAATALAGCSGTSKATAGDKALEVTYWNYGPAAEAGNRQIADAFMAAHAGVKVTLTPVTGENWGTY